MLPEAFGPENPFLIRCRKLAQRVISRVQKHELKERVMHRAIRCSVVVALLVALCVGNVAVAEEKAPDPLKVLKKATKNLVTQGKQSGYRANLEVEGGLSKTADHDLHMTTVRESYRGDIRGNVMHVPSMQVFRQSSKGAIFDGASWAALQARVEGKKLDRLFAFPVQLLSTAIKKPQAIEWLESTEKPEVTESEERTTGGTAVKKTLTTEQKYHRMLVTVPDKEALQYFVEVQNSGCLSGG